MDTQGAMQILNSSDEIEVLYNGTPVWLESINGDVAKVKFMGTDRTGEVPVSGLVRGGAKAH